MIQSVIILLFETFSSGFEFFAIINSPPIIQFTILIEFSTLTSKMRMESQNIIFHTVVVESVSEFVSNDLD